ncbi:MAG: molybdate ABC transporter substrate-binding protein [Cystobacterineae bacterium]|nr:molybdate ABC transporter substrate-binding protein [Cystobacterineae bacterium]
MKRNPSVLVGCLYKITLCAALLIGSNCTCQKSTPSAQQDKLVVFAAASLREAFNAMGEQFRSTHPNVELTFHFSGTQELRTQIEHGASADIFASADLRQMDKLAQQGHVLPPVIFTQNKLAVVVAKESAPHIQKLSDLPSASRIAVGVPEVPIGQYTLQLLGRMGAEFQTRIEAKVVSREFNAKQILAKVRLGEAQAGFVYRTDALSAPELAVVEIPDKLNPVVKYPMAVIRNTSHSQLAQAWVDFVLSEAGQSILEDAGFMPLETKHPIGH